MTKRTWTLMSAFLVAGVLLGGFVWFTAVARAQVDTEEAIAAFSKNGEIPWRVYSPECYPLEGEQISLEVRIYSGNIATNGRYNESSGWMTAVALSGRSVITSWEGWWMCFGPNAYEDLIELDPGAAENPTEMWQTTDITTTPEVSVTGPATVTLGTPAVYTATVSSEEEALGFVWSANDCGGDTCYYNWDTVGTKVVEVGVEDIWGAWDWAEFTTEVVEESTPTPEPTPDPTVEPTPEPTPEPEGDHQVFIPFAVKNYPLVCREPSETQVSFAGSTWQGVSGGCITLGGNSGTVEMETTMWFATNGRKTSADPWTNAMGSPGFYEFEWEGFLLCFGETEAEALEVLTSADPNSATNPTWTPDSVCVPE